MNITIPCGKGTLTVSEDVLRVLRADIMADVNSDFTAFEKVLMDVCVSYVLCAKAGEKEPTVLIGCESCSGVGCDGCTMYLHWEAKAPVQKSCKTCKYEGSSISGVIYCRASVCTAFPDFSGWEAKD